MDLCDPTVISALAMLHRKVEANFERRRGEEAQMASGSAAMSPLDDEAREGAQLIAALRLSSYSRQSQTIQWNLGDIEG